MKCVYLAVVLILAGPAVAAETPEQAAAQEKIRAALPLGGNFQPALEEGVFVAAGHGLNVVSSRDDGKTWKRVFYGAPCGDHGRWAVWNSVAYTKGVFAIAAGWGAPGTVIASDDGASWRHLTDGKRQPAKKGDKPYDMRTTMQLIGVDGAFIMPFEATPDFGRTWYQSSPYNLKDRDGNKVKVDAGHPSVAYGAGRVIVVGDTGPALYSDDLGKTWTPLQVKAEPWEEGGAKGIIAKDGVFILVKGNGGTVLRSEDKGLTWKAYPLGVERPAGRSYGLSVVGGEFWVTGQTSRASKDGITWRDLPKSTPSGRIAVSDKGTLINVDRKRTSILRSTDGGKTWTEVYQYTPDPQATGGAQGLSDVEFGLVRKLRPAQAP
ncbi:MAG: WD40/YVTN/BNR-like repeat-containing protein [Gemmataceae bacterium]